MRTVHCSKCAQCTVQITHTSCFLVTSEESRRQIHRGMKGRHLILGCWIARKMIWQPTAIVCHGYSVRKRRLAWLHCDKTGLASVHGFLVAGNIHGEIKLIYNNSRSIHLQKSTYICSAWTLFFVEISNRHVCSVGFSSSSSSAPARSVGRDNCSRGNCWRAGGRRCWRSDRHSGVFWLNTATSCVHMRHTYAWYVQMMHETETNWIAIRTCTTQPKTELFEEKDKDNDGHLNTAEFRAMLIEDVHPDEVRPSASIMFFNSCPYDQPNLDYCKEIDGSGRGQ